MTKDKMSKLIVISAFPIFLSFLIYDIKSIELWGYIGITLAIFLPIFYLVEIRMYYPRVSFAVGAVIWTVLCSVLFNDTFISIGLAIISLGSVGVFILLYKSN